MTSNPFNPADDMQDLWVFVPIDPESNELDSEGGFAEAFGGALAGIILGGFGLEHLGHLLEGVERWGDFQDALRPPISAMQVANAVMQWRCSGAHFAPGEIKGVWIKTAVPLSRFMRAAFLASQALRIPIKPATRSTLKPATRNAPKPATHNDLKPATHNDLKRPPEMLSSGHPECHRASQNQHESL